MAQKNILISQAHGTNPTALAMQAYREEKRLACRVLLSVYLLAGELAEQSEKGLCCLSPDGLLFSQSHTRLRISCSSN